MLRAAAVSLGLAATLPVATAQEFVPSRPVELVVHSAPGGGSDVFAQALVEMAEQEKLLAQPFRIVNKTKGASAEAMQYLGQNPSDGHVIAIFTNTWIATPITDKGAAFTIKSFVPIVRLVLEPTIAVVRADSPYATLADFVAAAKKEPGKLKQAGGSVTAIESLTGLLVQSATGAKWTFISTPAVRERLANLAAGSVDIVIPQPQDANEYIAAGKARAIAAFTEKRLAEMPDVSTVREQGIQMPLIANVRGIVGPPGMPPEAAKYWETFFHRLTQTPSWKKYVAENQVEDVFMRGAAMRPFLDEQIGMMRNVLATAGVVPAARTVGFPLPAIPQAMLDMPSKCPTPEEQEAFNRRFTEVLIESSASAIMARPGDRRAAMESVMSSFPKAVEKLRQEFPRCVTDKP